MNREAFGICGYISENEAACLAQEAEKLKSGVIVELGSYFGKSTAIMASNSGADVAVFAVDLWDNRNMGNAKPAEFITFIKNIEKWSDKIIPIREDTSNATDIVGGAIDLLFVDGDHSYEGCMADIKAWYPKVKKGGVILFHDYTEPKADVKKAVVEFWKDKPQDIQLSKGHDGARITESIFRVVKA